MASIYISEEQIRHYRTLTSLLHHTEVVETTASGERSAYLNLDKEPPSTDKALYTQLSFFTALLVRNEEVVAVLPCGERQHSVDVTIVQEPDHLTVTRNPRRAEAPASKAPLSSLPKVLTEFLGTTHELLGDVDDYGDAFLRYHRNVPFEVHCALVLKLLKLNRSSATNESKKKTAGILITWIFLSCYPKMVRRLTTGILNRNIWKHLTEISDADMEAKNADIDNIKVQYLSTKGPSAEQARFLKKQRAKGRIDNWNETLPVFDKAGRRMFRQLIQQLLVEVHENLDELKKFFDRHTMEEAATLEERDPAYIDFRANVRKLVGGVVSSMQSWNQLLETFPDEVLGTCKWIAKIYGLRRTMLKDKIDKSNTGETSPVSTLVDTSSLSVYASSSSPVKADPPQQQIQEQLKESENTDKMDEDIDDDDARGLDDIPKGSKRGWAEAVFKWMDNLGLHLKALQSLTITEQTNASQERLSSYLAKVNLKVVSVKPQFRDQQMQSYDDCMAKLEECAIEREEIKKWLCSQPYMTEKAWKQSKFNGTWHCEAILLSLHTLSLQGDAESSSVHEFSATAISTELESSAKVPVEIIKLFENHGSILMVSKRCCPSCNGLAAMLQRKPFSDYQYPLVYPGSHVQWSPVSLPPWLPERLGREIIKDATANLSVRFEKIKLLLSRQENFRKRSLSAASDVPTTEERSSKRPRLELTQIDEESEVAEVGGEGSLEMKDVEHEEEGAKDPDEERDDDLSLFL